MLSLFIVGLINWRLWRVQKKFKHFKCDWVGVYLELKLIIKNCEIVKRTANRLEILWKAGHCHLIKSSNPVFAEYFESLNWVEVEVQVDKGFYD